MLSVTLPDTEEEMEALLAEDPLSPEDVQLAHDHIEKMLSELCRYDLGTTDARDVQLAHEALASLTREIARLQVCVAVLVQEVSGTDEPADEGGLAMPPGKARVRSFRFPGQHSRDDVAVFFRNVYVESINEARSENLEPFSLLRLQEAQQEIFIQRLANHRNAMKLGTRDAQLWFVVAAEALLCHWPSMIVLYSALEQAPYSANFVEQANALVSVWRLSDYDFEVVADWLTTTGALCTPIRPT